MARKWKRLKVVFLCQTRLWQFIQFRLSEHAAQRCLRNERSRFQVVLHSHDRSLGIDHAKINDSVNRHRHVIACHEGRARRTFFHVSLAHHLGTAHRGKGDASHDVRQNPGSDEEGGCLEAAAAVAWLIQSFSGLADIPILNLSWFAPLSGV
jgi:hypothetical protein